MSFIQAKTFHALGEGSALWDLGPGIWGKSEFYRSLEEAVWEQDMNG